MVNLVLKRLGPVKERLVHVVQNVDYVVPQFLSQKEH